MNKKYFAFLISLFFLSSFAFAANRSIQDEVTLYLLSDEKAGYLNVVSGNANYSVVDVNDTPIMVFDSSLAIVEDDATLSSVISAYYKKLGGAGFTEDSAKQLNDTAMKAYNQFSGCNQTYYYYVETNYFIADYNCKRYQTTMLKCDRSFLLRAALSENFSILKEKMTALVSTYSSPATPLAKQLEAIEGVANTLKTDVTEFDGYYEEFGGSYMKDDPACAYDTALMDSVIAGSGASARANIKDTGGVLKSIKAETAERKGLSEVKKVQKAAKEVYTEAEKFKAGVKDRADAAKTPSEYLGIDFAEVTNTSKAIASAKSMATTVSLYGKMNGSISKFKDDANVFAGLFAPYNLTAVTMEEAGTAISSARSRYGDKDERVDALQQEYSNLTRKFVAMGNEMRNGTLPQKSEVEQIGNEALSLKQRIESLPPKGNELGDPLVLGGILVLIIGIAGAVFMMQKGKKQQGGGGEVDIKKLTNPPAGKDDGKQTKDAIRPNIR